MLLVLTSFRNWGRAALVVCLLLGGAACASGGGYQGLSATGLHALGQQRFDRGNYSGAIEALDRLVLLYPDYAQLADARFLMARAYQEDGQFLLAGDEYLRFLERHPGHLLGPEAALGVCRSYVALSPIPARDQTYTRQAYSVCRDVVREYGTFAVAQEAQELANQMRSRLAEKEYNNARHYYTRNAFDSAIQYWEMLIEVYGDTEWAPRALVGINCAWRRIGYEDDAEEARLRLLNSYPDSAEAQEARGGVLGC